MAIMGAALIFSTVTGDAELVKIKEVEPNAVVRLQSINLQNR